MMQPEVRINNLPSRHVPWMHMFEWQQVCSDVYSTNNRLRLRGYEKLLLWKSRFYNLPVGIRCTIELLYIDLVDKGALHMGSESGLGGEREILLMMSTCIMRFLNYVLECSKMNKKLMTMSLLSLSIPEWLIQVRHTHAHYTRMPSHEVLRKGVAFSLDWLLVNYWREGNATSALIVSSLALPSSESATEIQDMIEVWDTVHVYMRNGSSSIVETKSQLFEVYFEHLFSDVVSEELRKNFQSANDLSLIRGKMCERIVIAIKEYCCNINPRDNVETIVKLIMQSKTFIPSPDLLKNMMTPGMMYMGNAEEIMKWVFNVWKDILLPLQKEYSVFPSLIHELLIRQVDLGNKISMQQRILSLWINLLCGSMIKSRNRHSTSKLCIGNNILLRVDCEDEFHTKPSHRMGNFCNISIIKFAVQSANELTPLFLPSLVEVAYPILKLESKRLLKKLVSAYTTAESVLKVTLFEPVHTLEELTLVDDVSTCRVSDIAVGEWRTCPLGSLPWIKGLIPSVDFPEQVKWFEKEENREVCPKPSSQCHTKRVKGKNIENNSKRTKSMQQKIYLKKRGKPSTVRHLSKLQKNY